MRSSLDCKTTCGLLALLATLVLALPGVKAVRAEDRRAPLASSDGPQCHAAGPEAAVVQAGATMQQIQAQIAAQIAAQGGPGADAPILLNNRGYNYGSGNDARPDRGRPRAPPHRAIVPPAGPFDTPRASPVACGGCPEPQ